MREREIVDGFLPEFYLHAIQQEVTDAGFPWYFSGNISAVEGLPADDITYVRSQYGFYHSPFFGGWSPNSGIFVPIVDAIEAKFHITIEQLLRVRIGMLTNVGEAGHHYPHVDYHFPHTTVLLYLNESDGATVFYREKWQEGPEPERLTVDCAHFPVANRAVMFDGLTYHSSGSPTTTDRRLVLNVNLVEAS